MATGPLYLFRSLAVRVRELVPTECCRINLANSRLPSLLTILCLSWKVPLTPDTSAADSPPCLFSLRMRQRVPRGIPGIVGVTTNVPHRSVHRKADTEMQTFRQSKGERGPRREDAGIFGMIDRISCGWLSPVVTVYRQFVTTFAEGIGTFDKQTVCVKCGELSKLERLG